jgi:hypothetical protein
MSGYTAATLRAMWIGTGPHQEMRVTFTHHDTRRAGTVQEIDDTMDVWVDGELTEGVRSDRVIHAEVRASWRAADPPVTVTQPTTINGLMVIEAILLPDRKDMVPNRFMVLCDQGPATSPRYVIWMAASYLGADWFTSATYLTDLTDAERQLRERARSHGASLEPVPPDPAQ